MSISILDEMKNDFLVYAQEVNNNRAFCDARDGLKISQRAVLWEMYDKKYTSNKPHVKSAKVDGGVIANFHPHGSEYSTIVRMSQPWINNISEIDFHGANGSLLGGPDAAASRYTECRLSKAAEDGYFSSINKNQVDFIKNYSEDLMWPGVVLPAIFPRLFVNGSQGIGYTIAQEWEPGNLTEFFEKVKEFVSTGKVTCDNIYPDYPTGGIIINKSDIHTIYETGKGSVVLRGKVNIEDKYINITELPYQVYAEPFIQKIKDLVNAGSLSGVDDICNKSDDSGLLIEIACSIDPNIVLQKLYKLTDLQCTFSANQMALVDGVPQMLTLKSYIEVYLNHNLECLRREYKFDLDKAEKRKEVVDGLIKSISIIDNVISCIKSSKSSEEAKSNLCREFNFSENQAAAIVDMRLGKLANLETSELSKELDELIKTIDKCTRVLGSDKLQTKEFISRLEEFVKKHGFARHTTVIDVNTLEEKQAIKQEKIEERFNIILTPDNKIKRVALDQSKKYKDAACTVEAGIKDRFILISKSGKMYKLNVKDVALVSPGSSGADLNNILNDTIISIYSGKECDAWMFMVTENGLAKKISASTVFELSKCIGTTIMKLEADDEIILCTLMNDGDKLEYVQGTAKKYLYIDNFKDKGRAAGGVVAIKLTKKHNSFKLV